ncbi:hypothetical protein TSYNTROOL_14410 [Tepidanaerobacter syntrophicus]|uniref:hypothetical protein n=1 Tax=Tepidanaerobacter syntrophicus TaxID=224999 RepID=UPI0022ED86C4|nr:hypothetical protein [Tepidanaerobacter syntrophicus]GLI51355.1 hypothetical protein TSYNTROOL_14410 [Tepidanaerobacter syntrophicus]
MKYDSFSLKIEGNEVYQYIKQGSFSLNLDANYDNTCSFTLVRTIEEEDFTLPQLGQDVEIEIIYTGVNIVKSLGIITRINKRKIEAGTGTDKKLEFEITCSSYNNSILSRRVVSEDKTYDEKFAGDIVKELLNEYLIPEGISSETDYIDNGIQLAEYDIYANTKTVAEILDDLASQSKYIWFIDFNKKLTFAQKPKGIVRYLKSINENDENGYPIMEAEIEESTDDYRNRQIVTGGLGDDGYIVQSVKEDTEEIDRMKNQTGGTGIWEAIESATDIDTQAKADTKAEFLLNKYGKMKTNITITTLYPVNPGGLMAVNLPSIGISGRYFVETVSISDFAPGELLYELKLTQKKVYEEEDLPIVLDTSDEFVDYFKNKFEKIENLTNQKVTEELKKIDNSIISVFIGEGGMVIVRRDGSQTSLSFTKDGENRITNITNNNNGKSIGIGWSE